MNLICPCLVLFARRAQTLCFMCWSLCSSKAWSQSCASKWNLLNVCTCFQTHEHSHISHVCIMVVVHTHEFCHLDLAPSHHAVLYKSSQFVHIEYCFWWVATDEPPGKLIMANLYGVAVFLAIIAFLSPRDIFSFCVFCQSKLSESQKFNTEKE